MDQKTDWVNRYFTPEQRQKMEELQQGCGGLARDAISSRKRVNVGGEALSASVESDSVIPRGPRSPNTVEGLSIR